MKGELSFEFRNKNLLIPSKFLILRFWCISYLGLAERKGGLYRMKVYMLLSPFLIFSTDDLKGKRDFLYHNIISNPVTSPV